MTPYSSGLLLVSCLTCFSVLPGLAAPAAMGLPLNGLAAGSGVLGQRSVTSAQSIAQLPTSGNLAQPALIPGTKGPQVGELQKTLRLLGHFTEPVTGFYGNSTATAVLKFQQAMNLQANAVPNPASSGQPTVPTPVAMQSPDQPKVDKGKGLPWWIPVSAIGATGAAAGGLMWSLRARRSGSQTPLESRPPELPASQATSLPSTFPVHEAEKLKAKQQAPTRPATAPTQSPFPRNGQSGPMKNGKEQEPAAVSETTRLARINILDELVKDLRNPDPAKRQKVIWELGQRGDTRAVQPLVDLMVDSDSKQRSLILSALSEIGTRTLKPMSRALAISLQDENPEVRKNAIRDLTRIYDLVGQISQLLHKATDDPDREVQETARWALGQLNRMRSASSIDNLPALKNSVSPPESLPNN